MKLVKLFSVVFVCSSLFVGCASLNQKFKNVKKEDLHPQLALVKGKTPKEVSALLGTPISVGWNNPSSFGSTKYYMTYVVGEGETSTMGLMAGGDSLTCRYFTFDKEDGFKNTGSVGSGAIDNPCSHLKTEGWYKYDDSMIK